MGAEAWVPSLQGGEGGEEKRWVGWQRQWLKTQEHAQSLLSDVSSWELLEFVHFLHFINQSINHK